MKSLLRKIYHTAVVKNNVIKLINAIYSPPYRQNKMEFRYGVWMGISSIHCEDGRHLGENNTGPFHLREEIPTDYHKSAFKDSRQGGISNMTALHNVMKVWAEAMEILTAIRSEFIARRLDGKSELSVLELYLFAKTCVALPAFLARRKVQPIHNGKLSNIIAAEFQLISGVFMIGRYMMEQGEEWLSCTYNMTAEELFDYADRNRIFTSPDGHVCGGSQRKIIELLGCAIYGNGDYLARDPKEVLSEIVDDVDAYFEYAYKSTEMELRLSLLQLEILSDVHTVGGNIPDSESEFHKRYNRTFLGYESECDETKKKRLDIPNRIKIYTEFIGTYFPEFDYLSDGSLHQNAGYVLKEGSFTDAQKAIVDTVMKKYVESLVRCVETGKSFQKTINETLGWPGEARITFDDALKKMDVANRISLKDELGISVSQ